MRYMQLDSLRGLAAFTVVFLHATNVLPAVWDEPDQAWWLTELPLGLLRAGYQAVDFFFVLSGFVLVLPFLKGPVSPTAFIFRRVCRIWIPYIIAMVVAVACAVWFHPTPVAGLSTYRNHAVGFPSATWMLNHLLLVGVNPLDTVDNDVYNQVIWSLVYEMRISLIFPLLVLLLRLGPWWRVLGAAAALSASELAVERLPFWHSSEDWPMTLDYAGLFVLGMLLARDMPKFQTLLSRCPPLTKVLLWVLAFACYTNRAWLLPNSRLQHIPAYRDGLIAAGASLFIIFALSPSRFSAWLQTKPLVFAGKISYSVYLYHVPILLSLAHSFYGRVPLGVIWAGTGLLTLGVATLSYHLVEVPAIWLGQTFRLERKQPSFRWVNYSASSEPATKISSP